MKQFWRLFKQKRSNIRFPELSALPIIPNKSKGILGVNITKCTQCGICEELCPENAIHIETNSITIEYTKCMWCSICTYHCPNSALEFVKTYKGTIKNVNNSKHSFKLLK